MRTGATAMSKSEIAVERAQDPVCGMTVDPTHAAGEYEYKGKTYYFCSTHCLHKFRESPETYLHPTTQPVLISLSKETDSGKKIEYTCPMHPEVVRDAPGFCPICGMALEPRTATLEDDDKSELIDMMRRFWFSAALALPLLLLSMSEIM